MLISPLKGRVSSEWSRRRRNPVTGQFTSHAGIDIAAAEGTKVRAMFGGKVVSVRKGSYPGDPHLWKGAKSGNHVAIQNPDKAVQYYGHLKDVNVKKGDTVEGGQVIGTVGRTGMVTGPHLHLETWSNINISSHFNPRILFDRYKVPVGSTPKVSASTHTVKAGETLSGIAARYGKNWRTLAKKNGIAGPKYVIHPGDKIKL